MPDFVLTDAERVWLWRRRKKLSLVDASHHLNVSRGLLVSWEAGRTKPSDAMMRRLTTFVATVPEQLRVLRRRSGLGSRGAAIAYDVSHVSLLRLEEAGDTKLFRWYLNSDKKSHSTRFTHGENVVITRAV
jgi:transcriptional regulator with XRE-family HTH domain